MLGELVPRGGGDSIPLLKTKLLIGRRSACDVSLRFPNVSSHHCQLEQINGYWHVRDLGSSNGIKVNGSRCDSKWLMPGDVLSIAKHHFEVSYVPQSDGPPPDEADPFALSLLEKAGLMKPRSPVSPSHPHSTNSNTAEADSENAHVSASNEEDDEASRREYERRRMEGLSFDDDERPPSSTSSIDALQDEDSDWFLPANPVR
ncbi:MAG: FHA domain-containing protein [Planctomycetota bacterium]|nr:FHA domain-containing protein [Planctomycetota bacterium]MDA1215037.1 FHA domain-containing protein [Planctomycetota bacterium]